LRVLPDTEADTEPEISWFQHGTDVEVTIVG